MKKQMPLLFVIGVLLSFATIVFAVNDTRSENQTQVWYNYYHRNIDGTFILEHIDEKNVPIPLFSYKAVSVAATIKKVIGYYYETDVIKFIDEIEDNRIVKTEYFDCGTGISFFTCNRTYQNGVLNSILIHMSDDEYKSYERKAFFEITSDNTKLKYSEIIMAELTQELAQKYAARAFPLEAGDLYVSIEGIVNKNYQPISVQQKAIRKLGNQNKSGVFSEVYEYTDKGLLSKYSAFAGHLLAETKEITPTGSGSIAIIRQFDLRGKTRDVKKEEYIGDIYIRTAEKNDYSDPRNGTRPIKMRRTKIRDDLFLEYLYQWDNSDIEENDFVLVGNDERIGFDGNLKIRFSSLDFTLNIFSEQSTLARRKSKTYQPKTENR